MKALEEHGVFLESDKAVMRVVEKPGGVPVADALVVKIASRCNLNCDYCYMYHHVDQSYKNQPRFFAEMHAEALGKQISQYLLDSGKDLMSVCFHGGEPLLAGCERIESYLRLLQAPLREGQSIRFSIQTNGTLLTPQFLDLFRKYQVGVSLSLDGPKSANDRHRLDHKKRSSFDSVLRALTLLVDEYRDVFLGVLSVLDPANSPEELIDFFATFNLPFYDVLLPDANHFAPPVGKAINPDLYVSWIKRALTHWHRHHQNMPLRIFKNVCNGVSGIPTDTEIFGNGNISYLVIETDGSYHYSDLLKASYEGASHTGLHVETAKIQDVLDSPVLQRYQALLQRENLCDTCFNCPEKAICGAGQISHRYGPNGFNHPTVYCQEMLQMIREARYLVFSQRIREIAGDPIAHRNELISVFLSEHAIYLLGQLTNQEVPPYGAARQRVPLLIESSDHQGIVEETGSQDISTAFRLIEQAFPYFLGEIHLLISTIQFVGTHSPNRKVPSPSDERCLWIELPQSGHRLCAEHILHEFLHRKMQIFHEHYRVVSDAGIAAFQTFYCTAYLGRFWQLVALTSKDEIASEKFYQLRSDLEECKKCIDLHDLSEMGKYLFSALVEEFIGSSGL